MSSTARSTTGCWTCRLRKKKCDEGRPVCLICSNLAVTCYGYGPRPKWMDGKRREKDMAETIRHAVKETTAEKKRIAMKRRQHQKQQSNGSTSNAADKEQTYGVPTAPSPPSPAQTDWSDGWGAHAMDRVSPLVATDPPLSDFSVVPAEVDTELLMHYPDYVFPLQFPFNKSSVACGGRGWLLSILTTIKPLYHATISLAAYHRQSILCRDSGSKDHGVDLECLERQYTRALTELSQYLAKIGDKNRARTQVENINVLSCLVMLISLEIFKGDTRNWRMHLSAAAVLIPDIKRQGGVAECVSLSSGYQSALLFFSGVIGWYDILSCSTTGTPPFSKCECIDAALGYVFLNKIMGCENWAMLLIMDIAFLDHWKQNRQISARLSMRELVARAAHIERRLEDGIRENTSRLSQLTNHIMPSTLGTRVQEPSHLILLKGRKANCRGKKGDGHIFHRICHDCHI